jgi:hypothetical protein
MNPRTRTSAPNQGSSRPTSISPSHLDHTSLGSRDKRLDHPLARRSEEVVCCSTTRLLLSRLLLSGAADSLCPSAPVRPFHQLKLPICTLAPFGGVQRA